MSKHSKSPAASAGRNVGIDLGDKKSPVCIVDEQGNIVSQEWVVTTPDEFGKRFSCQPALDIAMEVGTHSHWANELLGSCGHDAEVDSKGASANGSEAGSDEGIGWWESWGQFKSRDGTL